MSASVPAFTMEQLGRLAIGKGAPLVICDVDDVVVHFLRGFESYLAAAELWLDPASFALNGNVRHRKDNSPVEAQRLAQIIDDFFVERTAHLEAIEGAVDALNGFARSATVVMLTNLPHHARDKRISNLSRHGLDFPVVTNSGPKGPAIAYLAAQTSAPVIFIDDSPGFIQSARDHAPHVHLVHFLHDARYSRHITPFDFVSLRTDHWNEAKPHIEALIGG